jgi:hypothetical protein
MLKQFKNIIKKNKAKQQTDPIDCVKLALVVKPRPNQVNQALSFHKKKKRIKELYRLML